MVMYQDIGNARPEANKTELRPLQKGQTIENALFVEEENLHNIQVRMKK